MEAGFLSERGAGEEVSRPLRHTPQQRRSQLYVPPAGYRKHARKLAQSYSSRFPVRLQSTPKPDSHHEDEGRGELYRRLSELSGATAGGAAAGSCAVPVRADVQMRSGAAGWLFAAAAAGHAVCV